MKDEEILNNVRSLCISMYNHSRDFKNEALLEAQESTDYYFRRRPVSTINGGSTYIAPVVQEKVDDLHSNLMDVVKKLKNNVSVDVKDINTKLPQDIEGKIITLIDNTLFKSNSGEEILDAVILDALITGTSAARWYVEEQVDFDIEYFNDLLKEEVTLLKADLKKDQMMEITNKVKSPDTGETYYTVQVATPRKTKHIRYVHVPFNHIQVDPKARHIRDADYACITSLSTKQDLIESGFDKELVMSITTENDYELRARYNTGEEFIGNYNGTSTNIDSSLDVVLVREHYVRTGIVEKGKFRLYKVTIVNNTVLDIVEEDTINIAIFKPKPNISSFWGSSFAYQLRSEQDIKTAITRGYIDNIHNANHGSVMAVAGAYNKRDLIDNRPRRIVEVQHPGAVAPFPYNPLPQGIDSLLTHVDMSADGASGISAETMGRGESAFASGVTATQISLAYSKSDLTVKKKAVGIVSGIKQLCKGFYGEYRKLIPNLPYVTDFTFEVETESGRRSKAMDALAVYQSLSTTEFQTPMLKFELIKRYLTNQGLGDIVSMLKPVQVVMQEAAQPNPANEIQMAMLQEQVKHMQAQTNKILQDAEVDAAIKASEQNREDVKVKLDMQFKGEELNLKEREQLLKEASVWAELDLTEEDIEKAKAFSVGSIIQ